MKKEKKEGLLSLTKETVSKLGNEHMANVQGGRNTYLTSTQGCGCNGITRTDCCWDLTLDDQHTLCNY